MTLVEKMAREIDPDAWNFADEERKDFPADPYDRIYRTPRLNKSRRAAIAVLKALREPTESMLDSGSNARSINSTLDENSTATWQAMIDQAIKEGV